MRELVRIFLVNARKRKTSETLGIANGELGRRIQCLSADATTGKEQNNRADRVFHPRPQSIGLGESAFTVDAYPYSVNGVQQGWHYLSSPLDNQDETRMLHLDASRKKET